MPSKRQQNNRQLYEPAYAKILDAIPLPQKLRCHRCHFFRSQPNYSTRQLRVAREAVKDKKAQYQVICNKCNNAPLVELDCMSCGKTQGIECFAKSQRNKPDSAECFACTDKRTGLDAVNDEAYEDPRKAFVPTEPVAGNNPEYWSSVHSARSTTMSSYNGEEGPAQSESASGYAASAAPGGGVSLVDEFRNLGFGSTNQSSRAGTLIETDDVYSRSGSSAYNGGPVQSTTTNDFGWEVPVKKSDKKPGVWDPTKYGRPKVGGGSSTATNKSFNSTLTESADNTRYSGNGQFAKIKAYKPPPRVEPEPDWSSESSDDGCDDDDDSDVEL